MHQIGAWLRAHRPVSRGEFEALRQGLVRATQAAGLPSPTPEPEPDSRPVLTLVR